MPVTAKITVEMRMERELLDFIEGLGEPARVDAVLGGLLLDPYVQVLHLSIEEERHDGNDRRALDGQ